jgi:hypothetical protein
MAPPELAGEAFAVPIPVIERAEMRLRAVATSRQAYHPRELPSHLGAGQGALWSHPMPDDAHDLWQFPD